MAEAYLALAHSLQALNNVYRGQGLVVAEAGKWGSKTTMGVNELKQQRDDYIDQAREYAREKMITAVITPVIVRAESYYDGTEC